MTAFDFAAAIATRPSDADLPRALGLFTYREGTPRGGVIPDPSWARQNLVQVDVTQFPGFPTFPGGKAVTVISMHRQVAPVFTATMQLAAERGLLAKLREYNGCYVPRHMGWTPGRPLSVHSWGAAVDFDASTNGYGVPEGRMQINRDFVQLMESAGWTWGGRWTREYADGMHFQWTDPLPGTIVPGWQDALGKAGSKPVPPAQTRRVLIEGKALTVRRAVLGGVAVTVEADGGAWLQPDDGTPAPTGPVTGSSPRVTLQDQAETWVPFVGRAVYRGLMLNLDAKTQDLWIRPATAAERGL